MASRKKCLHCETRYRMNSIGSLCEWCWHNVLNRYNSEPHRLTECPLDCRSEH